MIEQTVLVNDVIALSIDLECFQNIQGNVNDYRWFVVTKDVYLQLTLSGRAGINAYNNTWIGELNNETCSIYNTEGSD